jgi:hypothetical protein
MPISSELLEIAPQIFEFLVILDAGKYHFGARNFGARISDVFLERCLVPGDAGVLVRIAVIETFNHAGLAAIEPVENRTDLVGGVFADAVARRAFSELSFTGRKVLRLGRTRRRDSETRNQETSHG